MTKIALVLGGGVSLGAYTGGAVSEILRALMNNNQRSDEGPTQIHVITGTSAGALNAALAARCLAVNRELLPWIRSAWVEAADAAHLLNPNRANRSAWLDDSAIDELTRALLTADPATDDSYSTAAGDPLRVGVTLANLSGVRYDIPYGFLNVLDRSFGTRLYDDSLAVELSRQTGAGDPVWETLRQGALASSAFPFAFPVRSLVRSAADYPGATLPGESGDDLTMWYADGGLFDTAPLGLAKRLVAREADFRSDDWRYILVEPTLRSSSDDGSLSVAEAPRAALDLAADLTRAVLGQGAAQDWVRANRVNARLEVLSALVERLPELNDRLHDPDEVGLGRRIGELAERVAEMQVALDPDLGTRAGGGPDAADTYLDEHLRRIEADGRYSGALAEADSRAGRSRLAKLIFLLESAGGVCGKDILRLYLVAPDRSGELTGDFLGNFGGFFNQEWRANDFRAGRRDARRLLEESLSDIVSYDASGDEDYRVDDIEPTWESIPMSARRRLTSSLEAEADRTLSEFRPGGLAAAFKWAWKPVLKRWIVERATRAIQEAR
jgi:predicted acylesterase/phospholipase RssA